MNLKHVLAWAGLALTSGLLLTPLSARALEPAYGPGIVVDGNPSDWNLAEDYFADMFNAGRNQPSWPGFAVLSTLYLRYDCEAQMLYALVLDVEDDGELVNPSAGDAWLKLYGVGLPGDKLIDGNGDGGTTPRAFSWVYAVPGDPNSMLRGYEACAQLDEGLYTDFEAHLNVDGATSSRASTPRAMPFRWKSTVPTGMTATRSGPRSGPLGLGWRPPSPTPSTRPPH
jgi:hypothetical protein